jgi:hypothetical protein
MRFVEGGFVNLYDSALSDKDLKLFEFFLAGVKLLEFCGLSQVE